MTLNLLVVFEGEQIDERLEEARLDDRDSFCGCMRHCEHMLQRKDEGR